MYFYTLKYWLLCAWTKITVFLSLPSSPQWWEGEGVDAKFTSVIYSVMLQCYSPQQHWQLCVGWTKLKLVCEPADTPNPPLSNACSQMYVQRDLRKTVFTLMFLMLYRLYLDKKMPNFFRTIPLRLHSKSEHVHMTNRRAEIHITPCIIWVKHIATPALLGAHAA